MSQKLPMNGLNVIFTSSTLTIAYTSSEDVQVIGTSRIDLTLTLKVFPTIFNLSTYFNIIRPSILIKLTNLLCQVLFLKQESYR